MNSITVFTIKGYRVRGGQRMNLGQFQTTLRDIAVQTFAVFAMEFDEVTWEEDTTEF